MHDNPYQSPLPDQPAPAGAEQSAKRRVTHSPRRGAIIGALTGALPLLVIAVAGAVISYDAYAENDNLEQYRIDLGKFVANCMLLSIALAFLGALLGAGIVTAAKWLQARRSPTQP